MSSPIAFDDTQFDLDLSEHLDQFPDPTVPSTEDRDPADAVDDPVVGVVPVGDPWGVPADADVGADVVGVSSVADAPTAVEDLPVSYPEAESVDASAEAPAFAATTVEDVPVPWVPAVGGTATLAEAHTGAVDPPTSVHSVFAVTPPQGTPVVAVPPAPPVPPVAAPRRAPRSPRRRRGAIAVLAVLLAAGLVAGGAGLAVATSDGEEDRAGAVAASPGETVTLPPAGADADKPEDDPAAPAAGDDAAPDDAEVPPVADADADADAEGVAQASEAVQTFLAVRGTDAERAVSSQGGRDELDATIASIGRAVPEGDPACSPGAWRGRRSSCTASTA